MDENRINMPPPPKELRNMPPPPPPKPAGPNISKPNVEAQSKAPAENPQTVQNATTTSAQSIPNATNNTINAVNASGAATASSASAQMNSDLTGNAAAVANEVGKKGKKREKPGEIIGKDKHKADVKTILYWIGIVASLAAIGVLIYLLIM